MVVMVTSNACVSASFIENYGISLSNSSLKLFSSSGFSIFGGRLHVKSRKSRKPRVLCLNLNATVAANSSSGKEFEFAPNFDDYLKAMESVKSERTKKQTPKLSEGQAVVDNSKVRIVERENDDAKSGENGLISGVKSEKYMKRSKNDELFGNGKDSLRLVESENGNFKNSTMKIEQSTMHISKWRRQKAELEDDVKLSEYGGFSAGKDDKSVKPSEKDEFSGKEKLYKDSYRHVKSEEDSFKRRYLKSDATGDRDLWIVPKGKMESSNDGLSHTFAKSQNGTFRITNERNVSRSDKYIKNSRRSSSRDDDHGLDMLTPAFKFSDESSEVVDKPRISRMEMEDRIQKLAKGLNGADINMPEWMFSKSMRSARIRFSDHSIMRVIQILGKHGNWRRVLQVTEWFQKHERFKSNRLRHIYTSAVYVLGKSRRPVEALNVFNAMQEQMASYPDVVAYHSIAVTLGQAGHIKELFDVIDTMRSPPKKNFKTTLVGKWDPRLEPDIVVYNAVLNACVHRKQWEGAFWVLQQLREKGQKPSSATYGLVMEVMLTCGKYKLVHEFFKKMQKSAIPTALAYRVLVNTLSKEGKIDEAVEAVRDMERRGIVGSAALYYDLARCLCSAGRSDEGLKLMDKICMVASKPLVVTYTGLIQACLDSGNIQDGANIFNKMTDFCSPNLVTCNIMLSAYLECGFFEEARQLFETMSSDEKCVPNSSESDRRPQVLPDTFTFNTMLDACAKTGSWDDFVHVYGRMLHHGYHFNPKRHLRLILGASRAGKAEAVELTWEHLNRSGRTPPAQLIKERFCLKLENRDHFSAFSTVSNLDDYGDEGCEMQAFSKSGWLKLFKENTGRFEKNTIVLLIEELNKVVTDSRQPKHILENLLMCCEDVLRTYYDGGFSPSAC